MDKLVKNEYIRLFKKLRSLRENDRKMAYNQNHSNYDSDDFTQAISDEVDQSLIPHDKNYKQITFDIFLMDLYQKPSFNNSPSLRYFFNDIINTLKYVINPKFADQKPKYNYFKLDQPHNWKQFVIALNHNNEYIGKMPNQYLYIQAPASPISYDYFINTKNWRPYYADDYSNNPDHILYKKYAKDSFTKMLCNFCTYMKKHHSEFHPKLKKQKKALSFHDLFLDIKNFQDFVVDQN